MPKSTNPPADLNYSESKEVATAENQTAKENGSNNTLGSAVLTPSVYYNKPGLLFHLCSSDELQLIQTKAQVVSVTYPNTVNDQIVQKQPENNIENQIPDNTPDVSDNYYEVPNTTDPGSVLNLYDSFHRESDVLIGDGMPASMMFLKKRQLAKKVVLTGLVDGVGTTSNVLNISFALAVNNPDSRVLIVNGIPNDPTLYDRLNLPTDGYTLDQIAESITNGAIKGNYCLDKKKLMYGANNNEELYSSLPDNVEFVRLSMELYENGSDISGIRLLSVAYDYIIFDTKFGYHSAFEKMLCKISDVIYFNVIQDFSILKKTERYLNQTGLRGKASIVVNRYVNSDIDSRYISNTLNITDVFRVSNDTSGFVNCAAAFQSYFLNGKRKVKKEIIQIEERVKSLYE